MYFNTNYPHSDAEMLEYDRQPFRQYRGRTGVIEARIPYLQLKAGQYLLSLGLLPNSKDVHQFYEYRHLMYRIDVLPNGYPSRAFFTRRFIGVMGRAEISPLATQASNGIATVTFWQIERDELHDVLRSSR